ncbi:plasmid mobilization protein [Dyadobacter sp. 32]|uniref:plasmid mobilization protein n=1 Tax=Dyadobacter sp. 32 TaxID=538966 RepID=UPI0011ED7470
MENQKTKPKGRPPKKTEAARRDHFSVWVTKDEKNKINELIEKSGLSASQFFLTLALDTPFKRPQKKTLPPKTAETIRILEQLAGILSLAVLKTKHQHLHTENWKQSSQQVRLLSKLIVLWIFEDFEIRTMHKTLSEIELWMQQLHAYLSQVLAPSQKKSGVLEKTANIYQCAKELFEKYERYYQSEELQNHIIWKSEMETDPDLVHSKIKVAIEQLLKMRIP